MAQNQISPSAIIGEGVELGLGITIGPYAVILGPCVIEDGAWIGSAAQIGAPPEITSSRQNAAWTGDLEHQGVRICENAVIREGVVIHQGSHRPTTVGRETWILNRAYLAHDVVVGRDSTVSAGVSVGGHVTIGDRVNIGMNTVVHQRRLVSDGSMVGMGTPVTRDVPPYAKVFGTPPRLTGVNAIGLERAGFPSYVASALLARYVAGDILFARELGPELTPIVSELNSWRSHEQLSPVATSAKLSL